MAPQATVPRGVALSTASAFREALEAELERVAPDNPVAAARAVARVFSRFDPEAETSRSAAQYVAGRALQPFFNGAAPLVAQAVVWAVSDIVARCSRATEVVGSGVSADQGVIGCTAELTRLSDVEATRVEWLWQNRIPRGRMTILDGDPGLGKSALTCDLSARISTGAPMPDGSVGLTTPAGVVLLSAEDGLADTIRPRLDAAGADVERIGALRWLRERDHEGVPHRRLPTVADVEEIEAAIDAVDAALLVVDPLVAYLGAEVNAHRDQDVRAGLADLADLAERTGVAVLAVRHLNKSGQGSPLYRGGGSIGLIAAARSGLLVAPDPDDPESDRRVLASTKCNLARKPPALSFRVVPENGTLRVSWEGESEHDASSLLEREDRADRTAREEAAHVLREELADGPLEVEEVKRLADRHGISWSTFKRAKTAAGVVSEKIGGRGAPWIWRLPSKGDQRGWSPLGSNCLSLFEDSPETRPETTARPFKGSHLRGLGRFGENEPEMQDLFEEGSSDG